MQTFLFLTKSSFTSLQFSFFFSTFRAVLVSVATFCTHEKPWVRTMSRRVLRGILTDPVSSYDNGVHPSAGPVGEYAVGQLQKCTGKYVLSVFILVWIGLLKLSSYLNLKYLNGLYSRIHDT